ncbi:MAG: deoxyribonuclease IV [Bacillota bacterium]|nr:deoxyribonuclease IV [Bacillota bacterium]
MRFGVHVSIAGGLDKALERGQNLGCEAIQIFAGNPRGWKRRELMAEEVEEARRLKAGYKIAPMVVHTPYLLNLASPDEELFRRSSSLLLDDVKRAEAIGAEYLVLHPGSHQGAGVERGLERVSEALTALFSAYHPRVQILLENTAGGGSELGGSILQLAVIARGVPEGYRIGLCFDTCHAFAAGYDLTKEEGWQEVLTEIKAGFGLERLRLLHVNDAVGECGSHLDRHTHIGTGSLGRRGFGLMMKQKPLQALPAILETPVDTPEDDRRNLAAIREIWREVQEEKE